MAKPVGARWRGCTYVYEFASGYNQKYQIQLANPRAALSKKKVTLYRETQALCSSDEVEEKSKLFLVAKKTLQVVRRSLISCLLY